MRVRTNCLPSGSSPHMWGIRCIHHLHIHTVRFIPTHVGNTGPQLTNLAVLSVHPHTCGEYFPDEQILTSQGGSSPHMWGILLWSFHRLEHVRFIPTHVGNTLEARRNKRLPSVHPHTSGEYYTNSVSYGSASGSSPHKWGIPQLPPSADNRRRFIPTQVGNTQPQPK